MAMFNLALRKARIHAADAGKVACIRRIQEAGELPKSCALPGDFEGSPALGKIPSKSIDEATRYVEEKLWEPNGYRFLEQEIADKVLSIALDIGPAQAHRLLQQTLRSLGGQVPINGTLDKETMKLTNFMAVKHQTHAVIATLRAHQEGFYRQVAAGSEKLAPHLDAWIALARI